MARPGHSLLAALVVTTVVVTAALGWAGWRLLDQQRAIDDQRARDQLESGVDAIAADVKGKLAEAGDRLSAWISSAAAASPAIDEAVVVTISADEVRVAPAGGLPFLPALREPVSQAADFATIESAEFATG